MAIVLVIAGIKRLTHLLWSLPKPCLQFRISLLLFFTMGNAIFLGEDEEEDAQFDCNLESPDADAQLNGGTTAPNCQPKHTAAAAAHHHGEKHARGNNNNNAASGSQDEDDDDDEEDKKRQHLAAEGGAAAGRKMSYVQMAKMGYQELVNAIIRPPRADYKVCFW